MRPQRVIRTCSVSHKGKGVRVYAWSSTGRMGHVLIDPNKTEFENHWRAAQRLAKRLKWFRAFQAGKFRNAWYWVELGDWDTRLIL